MIHIYENSQRRYLDVAAHWHSLSWDSPYTERRITVLSVVVHRFTVGLGRGLGLLLDGSRHEHVHLVRRVADPRDLDLHRLVLGRVMLCVQDLRHLRHRLSARHRIEVELFELRLGAVLALAHRRREEARRAGRWRQTGALAS